MHVHMHRAHNKCKQMHIHRAYNKCKQVHIHRAYTVARSKRRAGTRPSRNLFSIHTSLSFSNSCSKSLIDTLQCRYVRHMHP